jgi:sulfatase modifying factor 1
MRALLLAALLVPSAACTAAEGPYAAILAQEAFASVLKYEDTKGAQRVPGFELQRTPVTNAQFLAFVQAHPQWQRGRAPAVLADERYLQHWQDGLVPGAAAAADQPVVWVSWFAAQAYCEAQGARLPTWSEWEVAAAADATRSDARKDPAWRERILAWYSRPGTAPLAPVGTGEANLYGVHDLHGLVWEWVEDYSAMLVSADNRQQGEADKLQFCGAAGLTTDDRENYAVLMRVAMMSSLQAADTTANLGFRCARDTSPGGGR